MCVFALSKLELDILIMLIFRMQYMLGAVGSLYRGMEHINNLTSNVSNC